MIPLWLAALIVLGAIAGILIIVFLICYIFIGWLNISDKIKNRGNKK